MRKLLFFVALGLAMAYVALAVEVGELDLKTPLSITDTEGGQVFNGYGSTAASLSLSMSSDSVKLTPVSSYDIWSGGVKYTQTVSQYKDLAAVANNTMSYVYFDASGVLQNSTTPWTITAGGAPIATVFKSDGAYAIGRETHAYDRDLEWHTWAHQNFGAAYTSGLTATFGNTSLSVTSGVIYDEDLRFDITTQLDSPRIFYRDGAASMEFHPSTKLPYPTSDGTRLAYDNNTGAPTVVDTNKYACVYLFATSDTAYPLYIVAGQSMHSNIANARAESFPTITMSTAEWKLLYRAIYKGGAAAPTYQEVSDYRKTSISAVNIATATDHASLTNRSAADQHPQAAITGLTTADSVQFAGLGMTGDITQSASTTTKLSGTVFVVDGASGDVSIGTDSTSAYSTLGDDQIIEAVGTGTTYAGTTWSVDGSVTGSWIYNLFTDKTYAQSVDGYIAYSPYYNIFRLAVGGSAYFDLSAAGTYTGGTSSTYQTITASNSTVARVQGVVYGGVTPGSGNNRYAELAVVNQASNTDSGTSFLTLQADDAVFSCIWADNSDVLRIGSNATYTTARALVGTTGGTVVGAQTSDMRLKRDIKPLDFDINAVRAVTPISFVRVNDPDQRERIGFSAQELQGVIPQVVDDTKEKIPGREEEGGKLVIYEADLVAVLWKAVQELDERVKKLEANKH
jgi:hypothetical protein